MTIKELKDALVEFFNLLGRGDDAKAFDEKSGQYSTKSIMKNRKIR